MVNSAVLPFSTVPCSVVHPSIMACDNLQKGRPRAASSMHVSFFHSGCSRLHSTMCMCFSFGHPHPSLHPPGSPRLLRVARSPCIILNLVPKSTGVASPILKVSHTSLHFIVSPGLSWSSTGHLPTRSHVGRFVVLST